VATDLTDDRLAPSRPRPSRAWLAATGIALVVVFLAPPLSVLARRYLFVEAVQFCVLAIAAPALVALGAPWPLFPRGAGRRICRVAEARRRRPSFGAALGYLIAWVVICLVWRLPPVLDGLARTPLLVAPEAVTLLVAGTALWLELVHSPPLAPRIPRPQRAAVAALALWSIWVIAYVLGFARGSVVHAYDGAGSHLETVADQEIAAFVLWAAAGLSFVPVVFVALLTWLKDGSGPDPEPARDAADIADIAVSDGEPACDEGPLRLGGPPGAVRPVRGWGPPARRRRRTSAR
jgi:cytochrome c oxidase assembly factor CtaG